MNIYEIKTPAQLLSGNPYPGRGIVLGKTPDGKKAVAAYFIMGRSENSRNRIFTEKDGEVFTEPFDASRVQDPSLIIYAALRQLDNQLIVTNGDQTDTIRDGLKAGKTFSQALASRCFEPDGPNFTPRISGMITFGDGDFTYHGHFNPYGYMSRDCTLFQDEDGTAYFISAARDNADMHVYRLSEDYMNVDALVNRLWQGEYREAPAVTKIGDTYYMLTSFCTGWAPNQGKYAVSDSMEGRWSSLKDIGDATTYHSQPAFILQRDGKVLYFGDRWGGGGEKYFTSGYVVYPLTEKNGELTMQCTEEALL